ncbi:MAG: DUF3048 domain-containing protein [Oscillospiraceae bacterium]
MKQLPAIFLVLIMALLMFGCSSLEEKPEPPDTSTPEVTPKPTEPTFAYNPLTGLNTLAADRDKKRPYAVSINNIDKSWPQYGISKADIVYEIETEGGITRILALFSDVRGIDQLGSVRSLRHQFVQAAYQLDPIIVHIGTSDYTEDYIQSRGIKTMNGFLTNDFLFIDAERMKHYGSEHCKFTSGELLDKGDKFFDMRTTSESALKSAFNFAPEGSPVTLSGGDATRVKYLFSRYYDGDFTYNTTTQKYYKSQHGLPQLDAGNGDVQLSYDNLFVLYAGIHGLYGELVDVDFSSGGTGYYFSRGRYEEITWVKDSYSDDFVFTKTDKTTLLVNPGTTHVGIISSSLSGSTEIS